MHSPWVKISLYLSAALLLSLSLLVRAEVESPEPQPRLLVGSIEENLYIARDRSFSFQLTFNDEQASSSMQISDSIYPTTQVITISSADKATNYRFEISRAITGNQDKEHFSRLTAETLGRYRRLIQRTWPSPVLEIVREEFDWNSHHAAHAIFKQFADAKSGPRYHIFYLTNVKNHIALLWTSINLPLEDLDAEDAIIAASSGPARLAKQRFLSLRFD